MLTTTSLTLLLVTIIIFGVGVITTFAWLETHAKRLRPKVEKLVRKPTQKA